MISAVTKITTSFINTKTKNRLLFFFILFTSLPSAIFNAIAMVATHYNLGEIPSSTVLLQVLKNASFSSLVLAMLSLLATSITMTLMNRYFLFKAFKTVAAAIKKSITFNGVPWRQNILLLLSFTNSLIFAEIFKETLSFLGNFGEVLGFIVGILIYFSSRFCSVDELFNRVFSKRNRAQSVSHELDGKLDYKNTALSSMVLIMTGLALMLLSLIPLAVTLIPSAVQGIETLLNLSIGSHADYQNFTTFLFGIIAIFLSMVFYCINIFKVPRQIYHLLFRFQSRSRQRWKLIKQLYLFTAATTIAFLTSYGFRLVALTELNLGYFNYLGSAKQFIPNLVVIFLGLSFLSVLLTIINNMPK